MPRKLLYPAVGERLKHAATDAGLDALAVAERLGVKRTTVYRWWNERRQIDEEDLQKYASLVGKPAEWFRPEEARRLEAKAVDFIVATVDRIMSGEVPDQSVDAITGASELLRPAERVKIRKAAGSLREVFNELAGGDWKAVPEERRRAAVEAFARELGLEPEAQTSDITADTP